MIHFLKFLRTGNCKFKTIVHGDAKLANFCFSHDLSNVAAVDFQYVGGGCGMKDVAYFLGSCLNDQELRTTENELLDFTYVDDAADGICSALTLDIADNKTYNITRGSSHTLYQAAKLAVELAGKGTIQLEPKDNDFPSRAALNIDRARQDLGFDPKVDMEEGFRRYYAWLSQIL